MRMITGLWVLAELAVFVLVASWIGVGWTILATVATSALGWALLAKQLKDPTAPRRSHARAGTLQWGRLQDLGIIAVGGLLMVLPGFLGDAVGLLCLLPGTRALPRLVIGRAVSGRLPDALRGPVHVRSSRVEQVEPDASPGGGWQPVRVIEGEVAGPAS